MFDCARNTDPILLRAGYATLDDSWKFKNVFSPFARLYYIGSGRAEMQINGQVIVYEPDYLYLIPPFTLHHDSCDHSFTSHYMHIYEKALDKESIFDKYQMPIKVRATPIDLLLFKRIIEINPGRQLKEYDPKFYDNQPTLAKDLANESKTPLHTSLESKGIIFQILSRFLAYAKIKISERDERINKALTYVHENVDKAISIADLADISCVSEDHFIRLFRNEMNSTPLKYINRKKIEKAQILLLTSEMTVRDIALELSIDNTSYFNRIFKQHTGKTPTEYRSENI